MSIADPFSNLRKVKVLLDALDSAGKDISYYALDLMQSELERTLADVPEGTFEHVKCFGLLGTYDDGLDWLKRSENAKRPKTIMSMGSSIGNFPRDEAADFLKQFAAILVDSDSLVIGLDACQQPDRVYRAYNDCKGVTNDFTLNGLKHANKLLGYEAFRLSDWEAIGRYDEVGGRHQAFVAPKRDLVVEGVSLCAGEKIRTEESYKYSPAQSEHLWQDSGVIEAAGWTNTTGDYSKFPIPHESLRITISQFANRNSDAYAEQARGDVLNKARRLRSPSRPWYRPVARAMEGLGYCHQADAPQRGGEGEADQASQRLHLLPWPHPNVP